MMNYHIMTLFPEMVETGLKTSIIGRAVEKGLLSIDPVQIRDYTLDRHNKVDDYPYGGGAECSCRLSLYMTVTGPSKRRSWLQDGQNHALFI